MSDQDKERELAEIRAQAKAEMDREMGLDEPDDENWEIENPYDYMPYQVSHPKGSAKEIEAGAPNEGSPTKKRLESKP